MIREIKSSLWATAGGNGAETRPKTILAGPPEEEERIEKRRNSSKGKKNATKRGSATNASTVKKTQSHLFSVVTAIGGFSILLARRSPSSLVPRPIPPRFPVLAPGVWLLGCGVLTSREAWDSYRSFVLTPHISLPHFAAGHHGHVRAL